MKKGIFKRITAFMLAIAMVFTMLPTTVIASERSVDKSTVTASKDGITVTKQAEFTGEKDENGNPKIKIDFTVDTTNLTPGTETVASGTTDIVLVIDRSGSMKDDNKMKNAKDAANDFVNKILAYDDVRVGVVSFAGDVKVNKGLTDNKKELTDAIGGLSASGGTFVQAGIREAQNLLINSKANNKIIILLSDGVPTYAYDLNMIDKIEIQDVHKDINCWNRYMLWGCHDETHYEKAEVIVGQEKDVTIENITAPLANPTSYPAYINFNYGSTYGRGSSTDEYIKKATISQAYLARKDIEGLNIYSVGYAVGNGSTAEQVLKTIADNGK